MTAPNNPVSPLQREARPAFVVGVTGHMDIADSEREAVKARLRRVFQWLRAPRGELFEDVGSSNGLELKGLGLEHTPIVVLTSLAPGADSLIAEVAIELGATTRLPDGETPAFRVRAPLPFPAEVYREATTFKPAGASPETVRQNLATLDSLLAAMKDEAFAVLMKDDWSADSGAAMPSPVELLQGFELDVRDPQRRHRRYAAAGEYVAAYSDLLIAIWDGAKDGQSGIGTAAIVRRKREGFTRGLLAVTTDFRWANTGPVLHIPVEARATRQQISVAAHVDSLKAGELLYPSREPSHTGAEAFTARAVCLERFNRDVSKCSPHTAQDVELAKMLGSAQSSASAGAAVARLQQSLDPLARLRWRASLLAGKCDDSRKRLMHWLCWLIVAATVSLHFYAHWHPEHAPAPFWLAATSLLSATVSSGIALAKYWCYQRAEIEPRRYDYRALCEGVRVQFYWNLAGIGRSAAAHYLQRQRGEMNWIRSALASLGFPYQQWAADFHKLTLREQLSTLSGVTRTWVEGQLAFYRKNARQAHSSHQLFHALGWGGVLAGLCHLVLLFIWRTWAVVLAPVTVVSLLALLHYGWLRWRSGEGSTPKRGRWWQFAFALFPKPAVTQVAALVLAVTLPLPVGLARVPGHIPGLDALWIIVLGLVLAVGAVLIAWGEKSLYAEHARQDQSMRELFATAHRQLQGDLLAIRETIDTKPSEAPAQIAQVQGLLFSLGKEALNENAEWLILHRARPLEPFVAG